MIGFGWLLSRFEDVWTVEHPPPMGWSDGKCAGCGRPTPSPVMTWCSQVCQSRAIERVSEATRDRYPPSLDKAPDDPPDLERWPL